MSPIVYIKKILRFLRVAKIVNLLKGNRHRKCSFPLSVWREKSKDIKNWRYLYSSLCVECLVRIFRNTGWAQRLKIKTLYINGLILYFPFVTSKY